MISYDRTEYHTYCEATGSSPGVKKGGLCEMSFVGLCNTNEGIIAFADQKATRHFPDGKQAEDVARGKIQKIFKNKCFIMVVCGLNEVRTTENNIIPIEDWINDNLASDMTPERFFQRFLTLKPMPTSDKNEKYRFIIGARDKKTDVYYTQTVSISQMLDDPYFDYKTIQKEIVFSGDKEFVEVFRIGIHFDHAFPIVETARLLVKQCEKLSEYFDLFPNRYNSVGSEFVYDIFQ